MRVGTDETAVAATVADDGVLDPTAFLTAHLPRLVRFGYALCGNAAEAEDLVAAAVLAALPRWARITGSPYAYVRQAVLNQHLSGVRAAARHRRLDGPPSSTVVPDAAAAIDDRITVESALSVLPALQRTVLVLRYFEDLPVADVAALLHRPAGSIRRITHEGLTALRGQRLFADNGKEFR